MNTSRLLASSLVAWVLLARAAVGAELPGLVVPDGLGVNIHFTDPQPGEMAMLAGGGFRWVRMDFAWGGTEREKGKYDFSAYDRFMAALESHKIRALLILDYSNHHYDGGLSPASDEGRKAFARWAAAAARHFRGRGILWEMYNEPNIGFWKPKPDVKQYIKLAEEVGRALGEAAPGEAYIGPATAEIDFTFLEECFKAGLLKHWSAVSVHPYRQNAPETAAEEYARLRRMIEHYAPKGKKIPILSGEWGYSSAWKGTDEIRQGKMLPRQWLTNLSNDVPISIWYDWHDDGPDAKEPEHHFGTVLHPYRAGREPVYDAKPAYLAAKTLATALDGFAFNKRLAVGSEEDYVLLFARGDDVRLAAWTTSASSRAVRIPASPGRFQVTMHTGATLPPLTADAQGLAVTLTDAPLFLAPEKANDLLRVGAAWQRAPLEASLRAQQGAAISLALRNPLTRAIRVSNGQSPAVEIQSGQSATLSTTFDLLRVDQPAGVRLECKVEGLGQLAQLTHVAASNPLQVTFGPPSAGALVVRVANPTGEAFQGVIRLTDVEGLQLISPQAAIVFGAGEKEKDVPFALQGARVKDYRLGLRVEDEQGRLQWSAPATAMTLVDDFSQYSAESVPAAWKMTPDGDAGVASTQSVTVAAPPPGLPVAARGVKTLKINYRMASGWKFIRLAPQTEPLKKIEGRPKALGLWVYGDGSHNSPRLRFTDAAGQTFQPSSAPMTWKGWRYVTFPLDGAQSGHWGGANDGVVRYPIHWDSLFLIDSTRRETGPLEVYLASPVIVR